MEITTQNLSKRFNREWIFKGFNFTFKAGNTYAIVGPNGSGKSTLLQILWGQMPPTGGDVVYKTTDGNVPVEEVYQHLSIASPYMDLIDEFTLLEQLQFHFKLKKSRNNLGVEDILKLMYLENARDQYIANFSSGMKQRVKLALAFFTDAKVIFLDEPGTNLDKRAFDWYTDQLSALRQDCLIIMASNQPSEYDDQTIKIDISAYK